MLYLELFGILFVFLVMTALNYTYILSPNNALAILFGSVNNSIWESIKVIIIPFVFWFGVETCLRIVPFKKLLVSKTVGLYLILFAGTILFRGAQLLFLNDTYIMSIFIVLSVIVLGFFVSYKLIFSNFDFALWNTLCAFLFILVVVMVLSFTVNPPRFWLFEDSYANVFGLDLPSFTVLR